MRHVFCAYLCEQKDGREEAAIYLRILSRHVSHMKKLVIRVIYVWLAHVSEELTRSLIGEVTAFGFAEAGTFGVPYKTR
jgi:hypothetical protein